MIIGFGFKGKVLAFCYCVLKDWKITIQNLNTIKTTLRFKVEPKALMLES